MEVNYQLNTEGAKSSVTGTSQNFAPVSVTGYRAVLRSLCHKISRALAFSYVNAIRPLSKNSLRWSRTACQNLIVVSTMANNEAIVGGSFQRLRSCSSPWNLVRGSTKIP